VLVYINFTGNPRTVSFVRDVDPQQATILLCSAGRQEFYTVQNQFFLQPYEVLLLEV
jgi:hypothetical protein